MKTEVTPEQIDHHRREGWTVVEDFLSPGELRELSDAVEDSVARMGDDKLTGEGNERIRKNEGGRDYYDRVFLQRLNLWKIDATVRKYMLSPELGEMLCRLEGIDGIRVWHDQTLQKGPWGNPSSWHIDVPSWSFCSPHAISIWIALDDATIQNGCMYYIAGSHREAVYEKKGGFSPNVGAIFDQYPQWRGREPVAVTLKAGDAAFHNGLMAHAAGPNMTPRSRRAMTCAYMPDGATFNGIQNILSDEQIASLEIGDVLDDETQVPLVWSKETAAAGTG